MEEQSRLPESARCPPGTEELGGRRDGESSEQGEMEDGIDKQLRSGDRPRLGAYMRVVCECGWVRGGKSCHGSRLCCLLLLFFSFWNLDKKYRDYRVLLYFPVFFLLFSLPYTCVVQYTGPAERQSLPG